MSSLLNALHFGALPKLLFDLKAAGARLSSKSGRGDSSGSLDELELRADGGTGADAVGPSRGYPVKSLRDAASLFVHTLPNT